MRGGSGWPLYVATPREPARWMRSNLDMPAIAPAVNPPSALSGTLISAFREPINGRRVNGVPA